MNSSISQKSTYNLNGTNISKINEKNANKLIQKNTITTTKGNAYTAKISSSNKLNNVKNKATKETVNKTKLIKSKVSTPPSDTSDTKQQNSLQKFSSKNLILEKVNHSSSNYAQATLAQNSRSTSYLPRKTYKETSISNKVTTKVKHFQNTESNASKLLTKFTKSYVGHSMTEKTSKPQQFSDLRISQKSTYKLDNKNISKNNEKNANKLTKKITFKTTKENGYTAKILSINKQKNVKNKTTKEPVNKTQLSKSKVSTPPTNISDTKQQDPLPISLSKNLILDEVNHSSSNYAQGTVGHNSHSNTYLPMKTYKETIISNKIEKIQINSSQKTEISELPTKLKESVNIKLGNSEFVVLFFL